MENREKDSSWEIPLKINVLGAKYPQQKSFGHSF